MTAPGRTAAFRSEGEAAVELARCRVHGFAEGWKGSLSARSR
jgi:hypothetical protein